MPVLPPLTETISDGTVAMRLAAERDIPEVLIAYEDDAAMHERLGEARPPSGAELGRRWEDAEATRLSGGGMTLTILRAGDDTCVGEVRIRHVEWIHGRAELGVWVAPQVRGRGLASRALRVTAAWLFEHAGLERVQVVIDPDNEAMRAAATRAGFQEEGLLRAYTRERDHRVDCAILSLLPGDLS